MKRPGIALLLLALLGAFLFWWFSPGQILKRRTESLLSTLTLEAGSGVSGRQLGAYSLNSLLASEVRLETPTITEANGTFERKELESAFSWLCNQAKQTRFELVDFNSVKIDGDTAVTVVSLEALVELPTYRPADGRYDVTFHWRREEDGWRLTQAKWDAAGSP